MYIPMKAIWYFDKPTVVYCGSCESFAIWHRSGEGLCCQSCGTKNLTRFIWDGDSPHPDKEMDGFD